MDIAITDQGAVTIPLPEGYAIRPATPNDVNETQ